MNKYNNKREIVDGLKFDSRAEARRYRELRLLLRAGEISGLQVHPKFRIEVEGHWICTYSADFTYLDRQNAMIFEDVKGMRTAVYQLKKKLMRAVYGVEITEINA